MKQHGIWALVPTFKNNVYLDYFSHICFSKRSPLVLELKGSFVFVQAE